MCPDVWCCCCCALCDGIANTLRAGWSRPGGSVSLHVQAGALQTLVWVVLAGLLARCLATHRGRGGGCSATHHEHAATHSREQSSNKASDRFHVLMTCCIVGQ